MKILISGATGGIDGRRVLRQPLAFGDARLLVRQN